MHTQEKAYNGFARKDMKEDKYYGGHPIRI